MIEFFKKTELKKGSTYNTEFFPDKVILESFKYFGQSNRTHVFEGKIEIKTGVPIAEGFILLEDHWMMEIDGVITYKPISSFAIEWHRKEDIEKEAPEVKSRLIKILAEVGTQV